MRSKSINHNKLWKMKSNMHQFLCYALCLFVFRHVVSPKVIASWVTAKKKFKFNKERKFLNLTTLTVIGWICLQLKRLEPKKFLMAFNDLTLRSKSGSCAIDFYDVVFMQSFCWETRVHKSWLEIITCIGRQRGFWLLLAFSIYRRFFPWTFQGWS